MSLVDTLVDIEIPQSKWDGYRDTQLELIPIQSDMIISPPSSPAKKHYDHPVSDTDQRTFNSIKAAVEVMFNSRITDSDSDTHSISLPDFDPSASLLASPATPTENIVYPARGLEGRNEFSGEPYYEDHCGGEMDTREFSDHEPAKPKNSNMAVAVKPKKPPREYRAMTRLFGIGFQWRSDGQKVAVEKTASGQSLVAVLATNEGKSAVFLTSAIYDKRRSTVVILPYVQIEKEVYDTAVKHGIAVDTWTTGKQRDGLVVVGVDRASSSEFLSQVVKAQMDGRLARVFFDEAHLYVDQNIVQFREAFMRVQKILNVDTQIILLSGTLPPFKRPDLERFFCLREPTYVRGRTSMRPSIQYSVQVVERYKEHTAAIKAVNDFRRSSADDRIMIFLSSISKVELLAKDGHFRKHHSKLKEEEKQEQMKLWLGGGGSNSDIMICCTSGLGVGGDFRHVKMVLHVDIPHSMSDYMQESGRGGRDGSLCQSKIIVANYGIDSLKSKITSMNDNIDRIYMLLYFQSPECRRKVISRYLDGPDREVRCSRGDAKCDVCCPLLNTTPMLSRFLPLHMEASTKNKVREIISEVAYFPLMRADNLLNAGNLTRSEIYSREVALEGRQWKQWISQLNELKERCTYCLMESDEEDPNSVKIVHDLTTCKLAPSAFIVERWSKLVLNYRAKYAMCDSCGTPQSYCRAWNKCAPCASGSFKNCSKDIPCQKSCVLGKKFWMLIYTILRNNDNRRVTFDRMLHPIVQNQAKDEDAQARWLGRRATIAGNECSNMFILFGRMMDFMQDVFYT